MTVAVSDLPLTDAHFRTISQLVYRVCGINLQPGKEGLVKTRLAKRVVTLGFSDFDDYLRHVASDKVEGAVMVDLLTTNKTSFFREEQHFDYLHSRILPALAARPGPIRIWSAGCSSGEEPYTLAMVLRDHLPDPDRREVRILATDISARVLAKAREGVYGEDLLRDVPDSMRKRHWTPVHGQTPRAYQASDKLRAMIRFARLNLMEAWPMSGPFDAIFCRNVMIYFDKQTQEKLVNRYWELLPPGGHLFVGHSESLTSLKHRFQYVQPAVYLKQ